MAEAIVVTIPVAVTKGKGAVAIDGGILLAMAAGVWRIVRGVFKGIVGLAPARGFV